MTVENKPELDQIDSLRQGKPMELAVAARYEGIESLKEVMRVEIVEIANFASKSENNLAMLMARLGEKPLESQLKAKNSRLALDK